MTADAPTNQINEQLTAIEAVLSKLARAAALGKAIKEAEPAPSGRETSFDPNKSREEHEHQSILARLSAIRQSLASYPFGQPILPGDELPPVGQNCRVEKVIVDWKCVQWGSTGNGGTAKCVKAEPIYEYRFICK